MEPCNLEANERKNVCSLARYCIYFRNASKCHITMVRDVCGIAYYIFLSLQAVVYYILYMQWFIIMSWFTEVSYSQRVLVEVYTTVNIVVTLQYAVRTHSTHTLWDSTYSTSVYIFVGRSYATDMYERWLLGIAPAIAVPSGRARANGTRASAHVTFQRTTSERKLCFSAKLRRQRCCLAERCLQGILPACRPIHCPRPGARTKKRRERARTSSGFSLRNRSSPQFLRRQLVPPSSSVHVSNAGPRSRDSVLMPATVIHTLCSRGDNQETVQPRNSARYRRIEPERRPASFPRTEKSHVCGRWGSHVTDNFTLRTMGGVHTCRLLRNVQQICCSAQTGQHSRLQRSCCPVWALQHIHAGTVLYVYTYTM